MTTRIEIDYDRLHVNSDVQETVARAAATLNVLQQLGAAFQNLPGMAMAAYQTEADALEALLASLNALIDQIRPILMEIDQKFGPLYDKNKMALRTLSGLLQTTAQQALLDQITGPTANPPTPAPPPPGP